MPSDADPNRQRTHPPWPAVELEELAWRSALPLDLLSAEARTQHLVPYFAAIPANIAHIGDLLSHLPDETTAVSTEAEALVREFDDEVDQQIGPFGAVLLRAEASASAQIENVIADAEQVALAELGERTRLGAAQVVGGIAATRIATSLPADLDEGSVLAIHRALLAGAEPKIAGHWRTDQLWMGGARYSPHGAKFVPPRPGRLAHALEDLEDFAQSEDMPPIPFAAITHAQFEAIHPFTDGNGRVGRAVIHALWHRMELTRTTLVPISSGLLGDKETYCAALAAYQRGEVAPIVDVLAWAVFDSVANARTLIAQLHATRAGWAPRIPAEADRHVWPLMDLVVRQPVLHAAAVQTELGVSPTQAADAICALAEIGALAEAGRPGGTALWRSAAVLAALDGFTTRAGISHVGDNRRRTQRQHRGPGGR